MTITIEKLPSLSDVWIVVYDDFQLLDATGPAQVFATANDEASLDGQPVPYRVAIVGSGAPRPVRSSSGVSVLAGRLPRRLSNESTVLVAGGAGVDRASRDRALLRWVQGAAERVRRCGSVCSGAFVLAHAGLLDGRRAVTHWRDVDALRDAFPRVCVEDDALYVRDGAIVTSAGVTSGIDLCLSLIEEDLGRALALRVAKRLVVHLKRAGGQRQFSSELLAQSADDGVVARLTAWLRPRLQHAIDVEAMADALAMSPRSLHRTLKREAGTTPAKFVARMRLETACAMLEGRPTALKRVATRSGFGSEYNLRQAFQAAFGVTPSQYRSRFG